LSAPEAAVLACTITVRGQLAPHWSPWFDDLAVEVRGEETVLAGELPDAAALFGLLSRVRDLGLVLVDISAAPATRSRGLRGGRGLAPPE
jgi:hypothetical protein